METVEAVSETAGIPGGPGSAPRITAAPAPAPTPTASVAGPYGSASASHATTQHWPTAECSTAPDVSGLPGVPLGSALPGPDEFGPEPLDLVTVPARQGLEAVDILRRASAATGAGAPGQGPSAVGPVLHDGPCDTLGFLVPPGTADGWDMPGSACTQTLGRGVSFDLPAQTADLGDGDGDRDGDEGGGGGAGAGAGVGVAASAARRSTPETAQADEPAAAAVAEPPVTGTDWLLPPSTDTVPVTDPAALRRALGEAARLIEAADRCR